MVPECYGCPRQGFPRSRLVWPAQASPGADQWRIWRKALDHLVRGEDLFLRRPLGHWLCSTRELDQTWDWYWDQVQNALYHGDAKHSALPSARVTRRLKFLCVEEATPLLLNQCIPADVAQNSDFISLQSTSKLVIPSTVIWYD